MSPIMTTVLLAGVSLLIPMGITALVSFVKTNKSAHVQNLAAIGGQFAREAVLLAEEKGLNWNGMAKFQEAVNTYIGKMAAAGFTVDVANAQDHVQAAHTTMSLDKTTAYNDKPTTTADAPMGDK